VDPSGNRFNPVYNKEGKPLGNTSEGFTGMPLISQGDGEHNWSSMTADAACKLDGVTTYDAVRDKLSGEAKSNIWTNIVTHFEGKRFFDLIFSMDDLITDIQNNTSDKVAVCLNFLALSFNDSL